MDTIAMIEAGMQADVQRLQVISQNLANISTSGFKKEVAVTRAFHDHLYGGMTGAGLQATGFARPLVTTTTDQSSGPLKYSSNPLDVAVEGDGYMVVAAPWGEAYTRQGSLQIDAGGRLVTPGGLAVLGMSGEIHLSSSTPRIDQEGNVYDGTQLVDRLRVVQVTDPSTLVRLGGGLFANEAPGSAVEATNYRMRQGYTEAANVVSMHEMIRMIETVRHFEASQKLARGYDDMLDRAINQLGEL
jgi:flagellar basal-body rod protein FlgF